MAFNHSFKKKELVIFEEVNIPFINNDDLLLDKSANARPKDLIDIEHLRKQRKSE